MKKIFLLLFFIGANNFKAQTPKLAFVSQQCGVNSFGGIFTIDGNGLNDSLRYSFNSTSGSGATSTLLKASNGKYYGTTSGGGTNAMGVIYKFDINTNTFTKLWDFSGADGVAPSGDLIEASSGKIYGVTQAGGKNNKGVIFSYDINSNIYKKIANFDTINASTAWDGLCRASNGKLYGLTPYGGSNNLGVVYSLDTTTNILTKLFDFGIPGEGIRPWGKLIQASDGYLYGLTEGGGANNNGTLFSFDISGNICTKLTDFYFNTGGTSENTLLQAPNGKLYFNLQGGSTSGGTLIEYDISFNNMVAVVNFSVTDGDYPGNLILASDGMIYGTTRLGGTGSGCTSGCGTVFKFDYNTSIFTSLYSINNSDGCALVRSITEYSPNSIGIKEFDKKEIINIYPNPTSNILNIKTNSKNNSVIEIINPLGQTVLKQNYSESIDVSKLESGYYILKITGDNNSYSKFVRE